MLESAAAVLLAYLMGTFPSAYVVGRLYAGLDIREHGSRNPGALNTFRQVGAKAGLAVLVVDGGKGAASVVVAEALGAHEYAVYLAALAVTLGHNFTPMLGFKRREGRRGRLRNLGGDAVGHDGRQPGIRTGGYSRPLVRSCGRSPERSWRLTS